MPSLSAQKACECETKFERLTPEHAMDHCNKVEPEHKMEMKKECDREQGNEKSKEDQEDQDRRGKHMIFGSLLTGSHQTHKPTVFPGTSPVLAGIDPRLLGC